MLSFIEKVVQAVLQRNIPLTQQTLILPSRRACLFVKEAFKKQLKNTTFLPKIITIEEFIAIVSDLQLANQLYVLFEFYEVYKINNQNKPLSFDQFYEWSYIALNDFNEIDRNLIDAKTIFSNLSDINRIENWSPQTPLTANYLTFFDELNTYYPQLQIRLKSKKLGYQGMLYREAVKNIQNFIQHHSQHHFVFAGFNALNKSEEYLFQQLLESNLASVYWDINQEMFDSTFNIGHFLKHYQSTWNYYKTHPFLWIDETKFNGTKIQSIGIPKRISQIKYAAELLQQLPNFDQSCLILADENLLPVALNSLPDNVNQVNITMGLPLHLVPAKHLYESLFQIINSKANANQKPTTYYYKDVLNFFKQSYLLKLSSNDVQSIDRYFNENILLKNKTRITKDEIAQFIQHFYTESESVLSSFFLNSTTSVADLLNHIIQLTHELLKVNIGIDREYLLQFNTIFQELAFLNDSYKEVISIDLLPKLFRQLVKTTQLSFHGEPMHGLQIMGVLESRALDFKTIILTGLNEGILPSGNKEQSFIPFDVKKQFDLPTFLERDLIFSYHFFRLLQRSEQVYLIYNSETDSLGSSEKSRFLSQLELLYPINQQIVSPQLTNNPKQLFQLSKTPEICAKIIEYYKKGISPSALATYIRNPLDFYQRYILGIQELQELEESIEAKTFGTIIHETLKVLYTPYLSTILTASSIKSMKDMLTDELQKQLLIFFNENELVSGKNRLMTEVAKKYIEMAIDLDATAILNHNKIIIHELEKPIEVKLQLDEFDFLLTLKGNIDRIDSYNNQYRIIDYKTGKVTSTELKISQFEVLKTNEKKSKVMQLLWYAYLFLKSPENKSKTEVICGNISFRNLNEGLIRVNLSPEPKGFDFEITSKKLDSFMEEMKQLILEIANPNIPFTEREIIKYEG